MKTNLFLTGLALMAITTFASAQDPVAGLVRGNSRCNGTGKGAAFVDKNNNGICDYYESRSANATDSTNIGYGRCNGTVKGRGFGKGKGRNFVDANKNGICDYYEARIKK
jgi:hypothetical protein